MELLARNPDYDRIIRNGTDFRTAAYKGLTSVDKATTEGVVSWKEGKTGNEFSQEMYVCDKS